MKKINDIELFEETKHWILEDKLGIDFAVNILIQDNIIKKSQYNEYYKKIDNLYKNYYKKTYSDVKKCPKCKEGYLLKKKGRYGYFKACDRFPFCNFTEKI